MILNTTSTAIRVITLTSADIDVCAAWTDKTTTAFTPGAQLTKITSATTTPVVSAPASSTQRVVTELWAANVHASSQNTVTIEYYDGTSSYQIWKGVLNAGERVVLTKNGAVVFNSAGIPKTSPLAGPALSSILMSPFFSTANLTSVRSITSTNTYAVYAGRAPRSLTSLAVRYRVTTAAATITWAEMAIAKGNIVIGGNPTLTVVGYADVSAVVDSTGQKTTTVSVSSGQTVSEGDDLWALFGNNATTVAVLRAASIADDLQVGAAAWLSTRPSLNVGNGQSYTLETGSALPPWFAVVV